MSIVKSISVGNGDMFYIVHNTDNFTIIDCCLPDIDVQREQIVDEIKAKASGKGISRFISTHPDEDHMHGLRYLDDQISIVNFYCVKNNVQKREPTIDFEKYRDLRDSAEKAFYISKGCTRKWMNVSGEGREHAGISILWPDVNNKSFQTALEEANNGVSPNNISAVIKYSVLESASIIWLGDLGTDFMNQIAGELELPKVDIIFASHHGRASGKIPEAMLRKMNPKIIVIGEAPAENLNYYSGYNTITQNSAGDITLECETNKVHIYVSNPDYRVGYLVNEYQSTFRNYIGTLSL